jgi:kynurenine formamidase
MKIIDLTLPIYAGMPVYPGDPEVEIEQIQTLEKDGWNMKRIHMNGHDGTHVNAAAHCKIKGKTLDDYTVNDFCGDCTMYEDVADLAPEKGVIFSKQNISMELAKIIVEKKPKFVGLSAEFEYDEEVEIFLLQNDIICFERLANTDQLPETFFFHGAPLKIREGDGSPIRAYAIC